LSHEIPYTAIAAVVEETLERTGAGQASTIQQTLEVDRQARTEARRIAARRTVRVS
jgi:1-deoxy-D-xylulose 5-phosphate reductoisomerase